MLCSSSRMSRRHERQQRSGKPLVQKESLIFGVSELVVSTASSRFFFLGGAGGCSHAAMVVGAGSPHQWLPECLIICRREPENGTPSAKHFPAYWRQMKSPSSCFVSTSVRFWIVSRGAEHFDLWRSQTFWAETDYTIRGFFRPSQRCFRHKPGSYINRTAVINQERLTGIAFLHFST